MIDYYGKNPQSVLPSAASTSSAASASATTYTNTSSQESSRYSGWGWFKKRTSPAKSEVTEPETTVKNTGTNFSIIHNTAAPVKLETYAAPKGIYIWGGPGCGKTYLMDLLYNSIQDKNIKKARVDFHSFMLEINIKLHQLRKKYGK